MEEVGMKIIAGVFIVVLVIMVLRGAGVFQDDLAYEAPGEPEPAMSPCGCATDTCADRHFEYERNCTRLPRNIWERLPRPIRGSVAGRATRRRFPEAGVAGASSDLVVGPPSHMRPIMSLETEAAYHVVQFVALGEVGVPIEVRGRDSGPSVGRLGVAGRRAQPFEVGAEPSVAQVGRLDRMTSASYSSLAADG
jgi:hypothetical protein